jgi:hypothetical protein
MSAMPQPAPAQGFQKIGHGQAMDRLKQARTTRRKYESTWFLNLAFNQGEQWVAHDGRGLYHPRTRKGQVRLTDNRVRPIVRSEVARLSKERPGWAATPDGLGDDAVNSALTATRLLEYAYDHLNFQPRRREAITWSRICGAGFIKTCWDPTRGEGAEVLVHPQEVAVPAPDPSAEPIMVPHPQAGQAVLHPVTQRVLKPGDLPEIESTLETKTVGGGDVSLAVRSPFDIFPDPLATSLDDARWIIDEAVRSPEYVKEHYGVEVKPDAPTMVGIVESGFHGAAVEGEGDQVGVKVYELWEPRSKGNPQGRRLVFTQQKVLYEGPNEYKRIPYTMFPGIIVPGRFWPDAVVTDLRPIQARWNKLLSQFAENLSKFGNPAMLIDALAQVKYTGVPGEKIKANFGGPVPPVQYLNPPSVPGYAFNFAQIVEGAFQEIAGHSETASGAVPPGVTSAAAISLLQEQSTTIISPDIEATEGAIGDVGQAVIELMACYYSTERVTVIVGPDGIVDYDTFKASASFKVPRISVVPNSTLPRSMAARQAAIRDILNLLLQYGVPMQKSAVAKALKDMQVGGVEALVGSTTGGVTLAQREWADFLRDKDPVVNEIDDDHMHIDTHTDSAQVDRFRSLPPERQAVWLNHIAEHKGAAVRKQQQDASMAAIAAGPPAAPGGPAMPGVVPGAPAQNVIQGMPSGNPLPADVQRPPDQPKAG